MRTLLPIVLVFSLLVVVTSASAQSEMPTELWSEYPLVQKVERAETRAAIGPFLPPDPEVAQPSANTARWSVWLGLSGLAALAIVFALRALPAVAGARSRRPACAHRPIKLREHPQRSPGRGPRRQYAPVDVAEPSGEVESRRFVMLRSGLLRSRFVVVADRPGGEVEPVARSGSFWSVGSRERAASDAWSDLVDELRGDGWEPEAPRSNYYVLLRRADSLGLSPTIDAYTLEPEEPGER